jgi:ubiquinone biosynthesis UbiH/UbiF/VisC/COQ6 family hydroxylase
MESYNADVIVVGRGLVGTAAALGLAQHGLQVLSIAPPVVAAAEHTHWDRRVYALSAASLGLFEWLRVRHLLQPERLAPIRAMELMGDQSGRLSLSAYEAGMEQLTCMAESRHLQQALEFGCQMLPRLRRVMAQPIEYQETDQGVRVTTEAGMSYLARLLVAADGADSPLRARWGLESQSHDYDQHGLVTFFQTQQPHYDTAFQWFLGGDILALLPLPEPRMVSMVYSVARERGQALAAAELSALSAQITELSHRRLGNLQAAEPVCSFPLRYRRSKRLIAPRVVFVGDAAHLMHPLAGQGLNTGLADVACLLDIVSEAHVQGHDLGSTRVLRTYERQRAEPLCLMLKTTDALQRLFARPEAPWPLLRNWGMSAVNRLPFLKKTLIAYARGS